MIEAWVASHPKQDMPPLMRAAAAALNAWKAKRPTHRAIAQFREEAAITLCERDYDWFTELLEDKTFVSTFAPIYGQKRRIDAQTALSAWVSRKLRAVSQTSNWFRPSEGLTYNLLATDLRGAVVGDLKLPMPAFYIELPPGVVYREDVLTGSLAQFEDSIRSRHRDDRGSCGHPGARVGRVCPRSLCRQ